LSVRSILIAFASFYLSSILPSAALAQGINTNVALAVAEDEGIFRSQIRYRRATDDPDGSGRELDVVALPQTLVYGVTPRLTSFITLPIVAYRRIEAADGSVRRDEGLGDLRILGRYTFFVDDYAPLSTRRAALIAGLKFPTGTDRIGTDSYDPIFGVVGTWAFRRHEIDLDALYMLTTKRRDFEAGDELRYDLAYRYRLWPARFGKRPLQLNGLLEINGRQRALSVARCSVHCETSHRRGVVPGSDLARLERFSVGRRLDGGSQHENSVYLGLALRGGSIWQPKDAVGQPRDRSTMIGEDEAH